MAVSPREAYDADLAQKILAYTPDLIVLAGWMHIVSPAFLDCFPNQVINLHPALPGQFAGTQAIDRAFAAYQQGKITHSGCMVHVVIPEVDAGPVLAMAEVPILPDDSLADFEARMHTAEHQLIVQATKLALER
jgi:formyltetrahydrofolate-dependent phosphoribosylglycinamide formyltransferase